LSAKSIAFSRLDAEKRKKVEKNMRNEKCEMRNEKGDPKVEVGIAHGYSHLSFHTSHFSLRLF